MFYKKVLLKEIDPRFDNEESHLRIYIADENESVSKRPGMLVCPGGGYSFCSEREGENVACRFLSEGFNCFVLYYTVNKKYPAPQLDLALVFAYIRQHEEEFKLLPNTLSIIGFSAGGHLVGSYGYLYPELAELLKVEPTLLRPFSITMAYPVVVLTSKTHSGTRDVISENEPELIEKLNIPEHVTSDYPPTFVWTTKDDDLVPSINSVLMAEALEKNHVPYEFHLYESGWHGASIANRSCTNKGDLTEKMKDFRDWASLTADFIFRLLDK